MEALQLVRGALTELDFPILTPASGLEKTFAYFSDPYWEDFLLDLDLPDPGDFVERPTFDPCQDFRRMFIGRCADRACEAYWQLVAHPDVDELTAFRLATREGQVCMSRYQPPLPGSSSRLARADPSDAIIDWWRRHRRGLPPRGRCRFPFLPD